MKPPQQYLTAKQARRMDSSSLQVSVRRTRTSIDNATLSWLPPFRFLSLLELPPPPPPPPPLPTAATPRRGRPGTVPTPELSGVDGRSGVAPCCSAPSAGGASAAASPSSPSPLRTRTRAERRVVVGGVCLGIGLIVADLAKKVLCACVGYRAWRERLDDTLLHGFQGIERLIG